ESGIGKRWRGLCCGRARGVMITALPQWKGLVMLTVGRGQSRTCSGVTRRDFLRVGGLGLGSLGLSLTGLNAQASAQSKPERSVILLLLVGGPSQLETFDPKP